MTVLKHSFFIDLRAICSFTNTFSNGLVIVVVGGK